MAERGRVMGAVVLVPVPPWWCSQTVLLMCTTLRSTLPSILAIEYSLFSVLYLLSPSTGLGPVGLGAGPGSWPGSAQVKPVSARLFLLPGSNPGPSQAASGSGDSEVPEKASSSCGNPTSSDNGSCVSPGMGVQKRLCCCCCCCLLFFLLVNPLHASFVFFVFFCVFVRAPIIPTSPSLHYTRVIKSLLI